MDNSWVLYPSSMKLKKTTTTRVLIIIMSLCGKHTESQVVLCEMSTQMLSYVCLCVRAVGNHRKKFKRTRLGLL